jgi:hypothetical protein
MVGRLCEANQGLLPKVVIWYLQPLSLISGQLVYHHP